MQQSIPETFAEFLTAAFDVLVTVGLTIAGLSAELHSVELLSSDTTMALWFGYMGLVALYAGVVVFGGKRLGPRLRAQL